jgi:tetratricopeptide (TPR) repeat protein
MTQFPSDKYTIAWFKLAEFVVRGEKERALGMYRLLVHSLPDAAFAAQLEGDLLLAFHDERALDAYNRSALSYEQASKLLQAAAIYEHLMHLTPKVAYNVKLIHLYEILRNEVKLDRWVKHLLHLSFIEYTTVEYAHKILDELKISSDALLNFHDYFIHMLVENGYADQPITKEVLKHMLDGYMQAHDTRLNAFLERLNIISNELVSYARIHLRSLTKT